MYYIRGRSSIFHRNAYGNTIILYVTTSNEQAARIAPSYLLGHWLVGQYQCMISFL